MAGSVGDAAPASLVRRDLHLVSRDLHLVTTRRRPSRAPPFALLSAAVVLRGGAPDTGRCDGPAWTTVRCRRRSRPDLVRAHRLRGGGRSHPRRARPPARTWQTLQVSCRCCGPPRRAACCARLLRLPRLLLALCQFSPTSLQSFRIGGICRARAGILRYSQPPRRAQCGDVARLDRAVGRWMRHASFLLSGRRGCWADEITAWRGPGRTSPAQKHRLAGAPGGD